MTAEFYVGSYAQEGQVSITCFRADFAAGTFVQTMADTQAHCPSWLLAHPNGKILYAVRELAEEGALYTFAVNDNSLRLISTLPTQGQDPCFLSLDESQKSLVAVNYSGSSLALFPLDAEGVPGALVQHITHSGSGPHPVRQEAAHPHCAVWVEGELLVCDLGIDKVLRYTLTDGVLVRRGDFQLPSGSGPRHLCLSPVEGVLYVVGELSNKIYVLRRGELVQQVDTLPAGFTGENTAAALKLSEDGGALFVSNRGHDSIAVFRLLSDGTLELADLCKTGGKTPRDFGMFGDYLVAANQDSDLLTVLKFDRATFRLIPTAMSASVSRPTAIVSAV